MTKIIRVLLAGESWVTHSIHQKGFDCFTTTKYEEGADWLRQALNTEDINVDYLPNHLASDAFPVSLDDLKEYQAIMLSDIGSNTLLLHSNTFMKSISMPNRLSLIKDYVYAGGGFIMIGGYLTFQGIDAKARYAGTAIEDTLPVELLVHDDRVETPEGSRPLVTFSAHPIVSGLPTEWPKLLGYNRVNPKSSSTEIVKVNEDSLVVAWEFGKGRSVAVTTDCGPHWCPPEFLNWFGYSILWQNIIKWVAKVI